MNVWSLAWRVSQHERRTFWVGWGLFVLFFVFPVVIGDPYGYGGKYDKYYKR